jgi:hypothetical protein
VLRTIEAIAHFLVMSGIFDDCFLSFKFEFDFFLKVRPLVSALKLFLGTTFKNVLLNVGVELNELAGIEIREIMGLKNPIAKSITCSR